MHALLEPTLAQLQTTLSAARWKDVAATTAKLGYQLVGHVVSRHEDRAAPRAAADGARVGIDVPQHWYEKLLDEEIRRRLRARRGVYLPWEPVRRQCAIDDERGRIEDYLHDEGYADAHVEIVATVARTSARLRFTSTSAQSTCRATSRSSARTTPCRSRYRATEIEAPFKHKKTCVVESLCFGTTRFTRTQHTEDVQNAQGPVPQARLSGGARAIELRPASCRSIAAPTRCRSRSTIDQRRSIDVKFEGVDSDALPDDELKKQLTFDAAGSSDDVEAAASAKALVAYLQGRGYFDARVTVDAHAVPRVRSVCCSGSTPARTREVREVMFEGNHVSTTGKLASLVATKPADFRNSLFGDNVAATSAQLASDVAPDPGRVSPRRLSRGQGDRDRRAPPRDALDCGALGAALVLADVGHDLYVRFRIDEGPPTLLTRVELELDAPKDQRVALCGLLLAELSEGARRAAARDPAVRSERRLRGGAAGAAVQGRRGRRQRTTGCATSCSAKRGRARSSTTTRATRAAAA